MEKYSISIMITLGVTWSRFTCPYFFQKGERLNGEACCDRLLLSYEEEGDCLFGHENWGSNRMGLVPILITEFNIDAKRSPESSLRKKNGHRPRLN